jgi:dTDP-4-dehydrorhamnose reductase
VKVLVFGAAGQLGQALDAAAADAGCTVIGLARAAADISDVEALKRAIAAHAPDAVINAAAYTAVDAAEDDREQAFRVNADGAGNVAAAADQAGIPVCHVSSDYVFAGKAGAPYPEDAPVAPLSVYGASKAEGERRVRAAAPRHLIVRASWVFSRYGRNFVKAILARLGSVERLDVIDDQVGCPTAAEDLAAGLLRMLARAAERDAWGTYHFCGRDAVSWLRFAEAIARERRRHAADETRIVATTTAAYGQRARRPAYSALDCRRAIDTLGIEVPAWPIALGHVVDHLMAERH